MSAARLAVMLPLAETLPGHVNSDFDATCRAFGLTKHRLAGGAVVAIDGRAAAGRRYAIAGEVFAASGRTGPDLMAICERLDAGDRSPDPDFWGDYLTLAEVGGRGAVQLARSACGNLPCFWFAEDTHVVAATSVTLLEAISSARPVIDWRELTKFLLSSQMRNGSTCLRGVRELPAGSMLEVGSAEVIERAQWSPWPFACSAEPLGRLEDATRVVGEAVDRAIAARCGNLANPVLLLSGGLDSSTVAAGLRHAGCSFASLNMVTGHRSGDERLYARAVARMAGSPLTERLRSVVMIDWDDPTPGRLVRPSAQLFRQPTLLAAHAVARDAGADTILDGGGGDGIFCSLNSVAPLLDRYELEGLSGGTWRTARDIALRADVGIRAVLAKAAQRRASGRVAFRWPTVRHFLTPDAQALASEIRHPWLNPPAGTLPGQAAHVALVLDALALAEDDSLDPTMRTISPLVAQPVVEAALRVRSWLWFTRGRDRAVVRQAFADRLPAAVIGRTGKGTPQGFLADIVDAHRARLRETLLDGLLAARGIVDRAAIEGALAEHSSKRDLRLSHLLTIADAERWARLWS